MRKAHAGTGTADVREIQKPDEQWRQELTPMQYSVLRQAHTSASSPVKKRASARSRSRTSSGARS